MLSVSFLLKYSPITDAKTGKVFHVNEKPGVNLAAVFALDYW